MNKCIICNSHLINALDIYCSECSYEIRRVRLKDEESLRLYIERKKSDFIEKPYFKNDNIITLDRW